MPLVLPMCFECGTFYHELCTLRECRLLPSKKISIISVSLASGRTWWLLCHMLVVCLVQQACEDYFNSCTLIHAATLLFTEKKHFLVVIYCFLFLIILQPSHAQWPLKVWYRHRVYTGVLPVPWLWVSVSITIYCLMNFIFLNLTVF